MWTRKTKRTLTTPFYKHYSAVLMCNEKSVLVFDISKLVSLLFHIQKNCVRVHPSSKVVENELPLILPKHNILQESTNYLES